MDTFLSDNKGNRASPGAVCADPVAASGVKLTDAAIGADHTQSVTAGARYAFTCTTTAAMTFGIADVTTAANVIWVCALNETIVMKIPEGESTLHYQGVANGAAGYLRRLN